LDNLIKEITKAAALYNGFSSVKNLARAYMKFSQENLEYWSMLFEYQFPEDQSFPRWYKQKVDTLYEIVWHAIERSVKNVDQEKQKEYVSIIWGGIHGITILALKGKFQRAGIDSAETLLDDFIDAYLKGIATT
ncbi:MAG: WHG domain-containing protein, partial [Alphaproteobacteria bacterium]